MKQKQQLLLLQDVDSLGKKGEIVSAKVGYIRNFLLPRRLAIMATTHTLRKQERLRHERVEQASVDRKEAEALAAQITTISLETRVKVDPEGRMYGSVSPNDIVQLFRNLGLLVERKYLQLNRPIKETGKHTLNLKLKESVPASCTLNIIPEGVEMTGAEAVVAPIQMEAPEESVEEPQG